MSHGGHATKALLLLLLAGLATLAPLKKKPPKTAGSRMIFQWVDIETCEETAYMNQTVVYHYEKNGDILADTTWTVLKPAKTIKKLRQIMTQCKADGTSCEHFMTWDAPMDGCTFVATRNAVWSPAFVNIRPDFVCPIAAGHYTNSNWTVDKDLLNLMPFPRNHVYKDRMEMWNEKDELFWCFVMSFTHRRHNPRS